MHGFRYNARVLARQLAAAHFGTKPPAERGRAGETVPFLAAELTTGARALDAEGLPRPGGLPPAASSDIVPLAHFLDAPGPDAVAVAIEMNAAGEIYPVVYVRAAGRSTERAAPAAPA